MVKMSERELSNSALFKRAEQLRRWEESETNREAGVPKRMVRKIQFSPECVFLAACSSGDKDEVRRLLGEGADINTTDADDMTALHQACIDNNLDMVEFLVENGADVNRGDNDGWTPLHATSNCGFVSIARYLIENGANVVAVNSDAELPLDVAASDDMEDLLQEYITAQGIDCDEVRGEEENMMMEDAKRWLNNGQYDDKPHPKTGATALHVAAAKGYSKVMSVLLQAGADVNIQDFDGWTPLHAAAYWGQKDACKLLVESFCDMEKRNFVDQTAFDVADPDMNVVLEELQTKQATLPRNRDDMNLAQRRSTNLTRRRISATEKGSLIKDAVYERQFQAGENEGDRVKRVEVEIKGESEKLAPLAISEVAVEEEETSSESSDDSDTSSVSDTVSSTRDSEEKKNKVNKDEPVRNAKPDVSKTVPNTISAPPNSPPRIPAEKDEPSAPSWRRPASFRSRVTSSVDEPANKALRLRISEKEVPAQKATTPTTGANRVSSESQEVVLRRTQSFEADEKFRRRYMELQARIKAGSCPTLNSVSALPTRSASLRERYHSRRVRGDDAGKATVAEDQETPPAASPLTPATPTTTAAGGTSPARLSANTSPVSSNQVRRSFAPPVRDDESETQRKAHAKRVRETRRSTQGVALDDLKVAEQLIKRRNQEKLQQATQQLANEQPAVSANSPSITATITAASGKDEEGAPAQERRPSWRLRVDNVDRSKFLLEDARNRSSVQDPPNYVRRAAGGGAGGAAAQRPTSAPVESVTADATVTIALRRQGRPPEDKEQDKENEVRNAQATQGVIQRRRKPKRRSTGVVHLDMDELDPERQESQEKSEGESNINNESGSEYSGHSSRLGSTAGTGDSLQASRSHAAADAGENGEVDYKKLYEQAMEENDRLREKLKKTEDTLTAARTQLESASNTSSKNSLSELEKRERRAMERKLSEMEEELKQLQKLKAENERLKAENRALTRVVSKLTNSANATK
ncbi:protein phosphatase 1 regulatory subunit 12A isoform X3 [Bacillus rossius redtenbacheri]|uniref:protein phosphatase 1 regulatory subunit 12A isoform X3 n=1 Tax=Bacillus rossius redtenbacheri TaxID=93214 RepID=UPI002FDE0930